jgi:outer membrane receptor protein involved in Fe transport
MDGILAYANVSKGYKAGSFGNFGGAFDSQYTPTSQESVVTYEGGFKTQLFDRKLSLNGAVFYSDYKDKQIKSKRVDPIFGPLLALVNVPKSQIKGFELEAAVHPVTGLTIGGSATYLDALITDATDRTDPAHGNLYTLAGIRARPGDHPIPYTSKWTMEGNFNYSFAVGSQSEAFIGAQIMHKTSTNASIGGENGEIIDGYAYDFTIPGYTTVDAQAGINFAGGKYSVMVWGKNIFNEFYITNRNDSFDGIAQFIGRPVTYGVTVGAKF